MPSEIFPALLWSRIQAALIAAGGAAFYAFLDVLFRTLQPDVGPSVVGKLMGF